MQQASGHDNDQPRASDDVTKLQEQVAMLQKAVRERDEQIARLNSELARRDERIQELMHEVNTLGDQCITLMTESERQIQQLRSLLALTAQINSSLDVRTVLTSIMQAAEQITNAEASSLMLRDEKTGELIFEVATGEKGEAVKEIRLKPGEGIAGHVAQTGEPVIVNDVSKDPRHKRDADVKTGFQTRNILAVPLRMDERIIGVLEVLNKRDAECFDELDLHDLTLLSELSAIAIDKAQKHQALQDMFIGAVRALVTALDARDPYTHGHSERVTEFALAIADELGLSADDKKRLELSALLHDIGKVGIEDPVLKKPGKLTKDEYEIIKGHPEIGYRILHMIRKMDPYLPGVRYHHEKYDGSGYPQGLKGEEIPLDARIIAVADVFDALTSDRPYRKGFDGGRAIAIMQEEISTHFDPQVFDAFLRAYRKGKIIEQRRREKMVASV